MKNLREVRKFERRQRLLSKVGPVQPYQFLTRLKPVRKSLYLTKVKIDVEYLKRIKSHPLTFS
jgi:hypothetical protein